MSSWGSVEAPQRALSRLGAPGTVLIPSTSGRFGQVLGTHCCQPWPPQRSPRGGTGQDPAWGHVGQIPLPGTLLSGESPPPRGNSSGRGTAPPPPRARPEAFLSQLPSPTTCTPRTWQAAPASATPPSQSLGQPGGPQPGNPASNPSSIAAFRFPSQKGPGLCRKPRPSCLQLTRHPSGLGGAS